MNEMWKVLVLCGLVHSVRPEFFHEPSRTELRSSTAVVTSGFGFTMAYQDSPPRLVVGAPQQDFVGKVFNCPLTDLSKDVDCDMIDMSYLNIEENTMKARQETRPDHKYLFGTSIAATSDYFLTCAPLLSKYITRYNSVRRAKNINFLMFGACYLYDNKANTFTEWKDSVVNLQNFINVNKNIPVTEISKKTVTIKAGGLGCNTLADTDNGVMLVAKSSYPVEILSVPTNTPLAESTSLFNQYYESCTSLSKLINTGYGMTTGNFFSKSVPLYAISTLHMNLKGNIFFLEIINQTLAVFDSKDACTEGNYLSNEDLGSMFGYALAAGDINQDGLSELIVGAPAQPINNYRKEIGAIHIYIGGDTKTRNEAKRMRTIFGKEENGRFGSAIATSDIDGDNLTEIFVSAPYENAGAGVVYVLSGFELNKVLLSSDRRRQIRVVDLELTQKLHGDSGGRHFGFSLQVIRDIDHNGCDELAIGAPSNSSVRLLRCLPTVTAFTTLKLLGDEIVKEDAKHFEVQVCLIVTITNQKCNSIIGSISVTCNINGHTDIPAPMFTHEITTEKEQQLCKIITVFVKKQGSTEYTFSTNIKIEEFDKHGDRKHKAYKPWAVLGPQSKLENSIPVKQYCTGVECEPKLSYEIIWNGTATIDTAPITSQRQSFVIRGKNTGADAKTVNLRVFVKGARISQLTNQCFEENGVDEYSCALPKPIKRDSTYAITVWVNTTEARNVPSLDVTAQLHDDVFTNTTYFPMHLQVPFKFDTNSVLVEGWNHYLNITDKEMQDSNIVSFIDNQEYSITNNGAVLWQNLTAILEITKEPFIQNVETVTTEKCMEQPSFDKNKYLFYCQLTLAPGTNKKIVVSFNISKKNIESYIGKKDLKTNSKLSLMLQPTDTVKQLMLSTQIQYQEILSVANNMLQIMLIVVGVALVLLLILSFALYKCGFFKRAEKKKLDVLRESVRKRSIRKSESIRSPNPSTAEDNNCEIEVVDDCVFQEVEITTQQVEEVPSTKDNVELIKDSPKVRHTS